jgi:hypothetical protein
LGVLFCELGKRTEKLFLRYLSSYYFSHTILKVYTFSVCSVFSSAFLLSTSVQKTM